MALEQHAKGSFDDLNDYDEQQLRSVLNEAVDSEAVNYELIKRITDVLAAKTNEKPIDTEAAYQQFLSQYAGTGPLNDELVQEAGALEMNDSIPETAEEENAPGHSGKVVHFSRLAKIGILVAAIVALFLAISVVASAMGFNIWRANVSWDKDNMGLSTVEEVSTAIEKDPYSELRTAIQREDVQEELIPSYLPNGYYLVDLRFLDTYEGHIYKAVFQSETKTFRFVLVFNPDSINSYYPKDAVEPEIYSVNGIEHYLSSNEGLYQAVWANGDTVCKLYGLESKEELLRIIDSIYKE